MIRLNYRDRGIGLQETDLYETGVGQMWRKTLRALAWILVVWGVGTCAVSIFYLGLKITTIEDALLGEASGGLLMAAGYWLKFKTRAEPIDRRKSG